MTVETPGFNNVPGKQKIVIQQCLNPMTGIVTFDLELHARMTMDMGIVNRLFDSDENEVFAKGVIKDTIVCPLSYEAIGFLAERLKNDEFVIMKNGYPEVISG